jgi:hypothetical protein
MVPLAWGSGATANLKRRRYEVLYTQRLVPLAEERDEQSNESSISIKGREILDKF